MSEYSTTDKHEEIKKNQSQAPISKVFQLYLKIINASMNIFLMQETFRKQKTFQNSYDARDLVESPSTYLDKLDHLSSRLTLSDNEGK